MSSRASQIPSKVFSALNGNEVMEVILTQMRTQMENDDRFSQALTYPVVEWTWDLNLRFYPSNSDGDKIQLQEKGQASGKGVDFSKLPKPLNAKLSGSEKTDEPDRTRMEHGLPVSHPERTAQGNFVDKPQPVAKPKIEVPVLDEEEDL